MGILLDEKDGKPTPTSICIRCDAFDGFPCLLNGKADAQVMCVDPALKAHPNLTLLTGAYVSKLETDAIGTGRSRAFDVTEAGQEERYSADIVVVACGALSSALLLLRSANDKHPNGLANGSDQVGRNYMRHNQSILMALMREPNDTVFQKTLAVSDYYFGSDDWDFPLGLIQMCATSHGAQIRGEALPGWLEWVPKMPFEEMARHSMDFWLSSEDLPRPENRIFYDGDRVVLDITEGNMEAHHRLKKKLEQMLGQRRRASRAAGAKPVSRQEHSDRRDGASGRHRAVRHRSGDLGAGSGSALVTATISTAVSVVALQMLLQMSPSPSARAVRVADRPKSAAPKKAPKRKNALRRETPEASSFVKLSSGVFMLFFPFL